MNEDLGKEFSKRGNPLKRSGPLNDLPDTKNYKVFCAHPLTRPRTPKICPYILGRFSNLFLQAFNSKFLGEKASFH